jgi:hypothetical protein
MQLFICEVDSVLRPLPGNILLVGPTIVMPLSGQRNAPVRYEIEPPFALPAPGHYAIAIKESEAECNRGFPLLADSLLEYPDGTAWTIHPWFDCHLLGANAGQMQRDLIFDVEFCQPSTASVRDTWGRVKAGYR